MFSLLYLKKKILKEIAIALVIFFSINYRYFGNKTNFFK